MQITLDEHSGFCFGVVKAITKAEELLKDGKPIYCLGDIVHNRLEVQRLREAGLHIITLDEFSETLRNQTVLIRAHGEPPLTYATAACHGIVIVDATCPVVAKLQKIVRQAFLKMAPLGGTVVILGKKGHAEVVGLTGQTDGQALVIEHAEDLNEVNYARPVYFLSQTTQSLKLFAEISELLRERMDAGLLTIHDTICRNVANREPHLTEFATRFDVVLFVCGHKSSNGEVLFRTCLRANSRTYKVEDAIEIKPEWFQNCQSVGICGATSTPLWVMQRVAERISTLNA